MKQRRPDKKLNLNKKTIAVLDNRQINAAYGGIDPDESDFDCQIFCKTGNPVSCPPPETQDPTATVLPRICPCCY